LNDITLPKPNFEKNSPKISKITGFNDIQNCIRDLEKLVEMMKLESQRSTGKDYIINGFLNEIVEISSACILRK